MTENNIYSNTNTTPLEKQTRFLFFAALTICLFGQLFYLSTWPGYEMGNNISYLGLLVLLPRFVAVLGCMRQVQSVIILLISPFVLYTCFNVIDKINIILPFAFIISAKNIRFKLIIKYFFVINLAFLLVSMLACQVGIIEDKVVDRDIINIMGETTGDNVSRHSFGYNWVTAFPAHVTYLWAMWLYLRKGILFFYEYFLLIFSIWFVFHYCNARMETVGMAMFIVISFYYRVRIAKGRIFAFEKMYFIFSVPIYAIIMIYLTYQYRVDGGETYELMNIVMSNRLMLGSDAMFTEGIPMFGQPFIQMGGDDSGSAYNFIDCSYLVWLIIYGVFFFILAVLSLVSVCYKSVTKREYLIAVIISVLAMEASIVSVFLKFSYNPFFMALFANTFSSMNKNIETKK